MAATPTRGGRDRPVGAEVRAFVRDWAILVGVILVYFFLRALAPVDEDRAVRVTLRLIHFEKATHTFWERDLQSATLHWSWLKEIANYIYSYLHFPSLALMGILLWFNDRPQFRLVRNTMFVSMAIGLVLYYTVPAAPPRLLAVHGHDFGFIDTVFGGNTSVEYPAPFFFVNNYAAIPSFHFGWIALAAWGLWTSGYGLPVKLAAIALTVLMTWASAATANHLFVDMALGGVVIVASWAIARFLIPPTAIRAGRGRGSGRARSADVAGLPGR